MMYYLHRGSWYCRYFLYPWPRHLPPQQQLCPNYSSHIWDTVWKTGEIVQKSFSIVWSSILALHFFYRNFAGQSSLRHIGQGLGFRVDSWACSMIFCLIILEQHGRATWHSPNPILKPHHLYNIWEKAAPVTSTSKYYYYRCCCWSWLWLWLWLCITYYDYSFCHLKMCSAYIVPYHTVHL